MPGSSPLLSVPYPVGGDAPLGHSQMETLVRELEKYGVIPVADTTERDSVITAGLRHAGTMCYITGTESLQVYDGTVWRTYYSSQYGPERGVISSAQPLPSASGNQGRLIYDQTIDAVKYSDGSTWTRLVDNNILRQADGVYDGTTCTTTALVTGGGETNPSGASPIYARVIVPENKKLLITVSAQMQIDTTGEQVRFGWVVRNDANTQDLQGPNLLRAARNRSLDVHESASWTSLVSMSAQSEGDYVRVYGVHAVSAGEGTYTSREVVVQPVR